MNINITESATNELKKILNEKPEETKKIRINLAGFG